MKNRSCFSPTAFKSTELQIKFKLLPMASETQCSLAPGQPLGAHLPCPCPGSLMLSWEQPEGSCCSVLAVATPLQGTARPLPVPGHIFAPPRSLPQGGFLRENSSEPLSELPNSYCFLVLPSFRVIWNHPCSSFLGPCPQTTLQGPSSVARPLSVLCALFPQLLPPCFAHQKFSTDLCWMSEDIDQT